MTCQSCIHWSPKKSGPMAKQGFALCAIGPVWKYLAPQHTCQKHKPAEESVVSARVAWLSSPAQRKRGG